MADDTDSELRVENERQTEDAELLRRYVAEKSEAAFAELVRRHLDLVYSVALRQVGVRAQLAEEVAQVVFTALARKAAALAERPVLGGWLYRTTQFTAVDVVRAESRRRARETEVFRMQDTTTDGGGDVMDWEKIRPTLDRVIGELREEERDAVVLRFFEGKSFADVGVRLRLSENAARMRVERALDKLHAGLARRGVTSTTAALSVALASQAGVAAPTGLAASVTGAALAGAGAGVAAASAGVVTFFMGMTKLQVVVAIAVVGAIGIAWQNRTPSEQARKAEGSSPMRAERRDDGARPSLVVKKPGDALTVVHATVPRNEVASATPVASVAPTPRALERNNLTTGMVRVEECQNVGLATPEDALQTFVWAAIQGQMSELAATLELAGAAREKAEAWLTALPESAKAKYPTAESLPALFLTEEIVRKAVSLQVATVDYASAAEATVEAKTESTDGRVSISKFPVKQSSGVWRIVVSEQMVDGMRQAVAKPRRNR